MAGRLLRGTRSKTSTSDIALVSKHSLIFLSRIQYQTLKIGSSNWKQVDLVVAGPEQPLVDGIQAAFKKGATP